MKLKLVFSPLLQSLTLFCVVRVVVLGLTDCEGYHLYSFFPFVSRDRI